MPRRRDIETILVVGAGPIVIGQACEFDYSGSQACKVLRDEGYRVILVNSNPATIMTDPELAHVTYVEPTVPDTVRQIIVRERPDALLPTMGGQTALNIALALSEDGTLERYGVELIGASIDAIHRAEDRERFRETMRSIGLATPESATAGTLAEAEAVVAKLGLPAVVRPSFTLGGAGGGIARTPEEFRSIVQGGLDLSPVTQVLVEESVIGWKEFEMEVIRDRADNAIIVCSIENVDPMGVHTGDSITVAPALTLTDKEYQSLRDASIAILRAIGVETGGSNVQFAINPADGRIVVIEMNPRVSRSSALASKATGFPIAKVAARLAVGYTLDEIMNDVTGTTPASFEPVIDYIVTKVPRFTFEKFPGADPALTTSMKSVGEAMAIGRNFAESLQKALRSLELGLTGFDAVDVPRGRNGVDRRALLERLAQPTPRRVLLLAQAFREGLSLPEIHAATNIDPWFLARIEEIVLVEAELAGHGLPADPDALRRIKSLGFADARIALLTNRDESAVAAARRALGVRPAFRRVDTCAGEFAASTPYFYGSYEEGVSDSGETAPGDRRKVVILGGGPNRIGQGIEFDYCCVHAALALSGVGIETIMINCNPETVSTDYDTSDRLYFEPLTGEDVVEIIDAERGAGEFVGCIVQFGGQTPLRLAQALVAADIPVIGTSPDAIDLAEDRDRFSGLLARLDIRQPENGSCRTPDEAVRIAERIGYPVMVRPSYVLGGSAMEVVHDEASLVDYVRRAVHRHGSDDPILIDAFLSSAIEVDVDALSDGTTVVIGGVMEHVEEAGIHSGDSACSLPPHSLPDEVIEAIKEQTETLALSLGVVGLMNVQFAVTRATPERPREVYVLEANPRASRTVPFVSKTTGNPLAHMASLVMGAGRKIADLNVRPWRDGHIAVKEAVFPFRRFPGADTLLGPEMKSTGEVMGIDRSFANAFAKAQVGAGTVLPTTGTLFLSVRDADKEDFVPVCKAFARYGFRLLGTTGTARFMHAHGIEIEPVKKVYEGSPHVVDAIRNGEVDMLFNTTEGAQSIADSLSMRREALNAGIPCFTTLAGSLAVVEAIEGMRSASLDVAPLQSYLG